MKYWLMPVAGVLSLTLSGPVAAYVGPGAGLSLLGALWALVIAVGAALVFLVAWPLRRMRRRRLEETSGAEEAAEPAPADAAPVTSMSSGRASER